MDGLIPPWDWARIFLEPWRGDEFQGSLWIFLMGFFVATACGWVGQFLVLRRMALVGDAISHSILPGIVIAFLFTGSRGSGAMIVGALVAALLTTVIIEIIHRRSRVKQDAAIGIAFTSLFAIGVVLVSVYTAQVDLDLDCVLHGEILMLPLELPYVEVAGATLGPASMVRMGVLTVLTAVLVIAFYKELLVSSFDAGLASSLGINSSWIHYGLMGWLSVVVVGSFESVGAILVVAMLVLPGATVALLTHRLPVALGLIPAVAALSALGGFHLSRAFDCSTAGAMVVAACGWFLLAWVFGPEGGQLPKRWRRQADLAESPG